MNSTHSNKKLSKSRSSSSAKDSIKSTPHNLSSHTHTQKHSRNNNSNTNTHGNSSSQTQSSSTSNHNNRDPTSNQAAFNFLSNISLSSNKPRTTSIDIPNNDVPPSSNPSTSKSTTSKSISPTSSAKASSPLVKVGSYEKTKIDRSISASNDKDKKEKEKTTPRKPPVHAFSSSILETHHHQHPQPLSSSAVVGHSDGHSHPTAGVTKKNSMTDIHQLKTQRSNIDAVDFLKGISLSGDSQKRSKPEPNASELSQLNNSKDSITNSGNTTNTNLHSNALMNATNNVNDLQQSKKILKKDYNRGVKPKGAAILRDLNKSGANNRVVFTKSQTGRYPMTVFSVITRFDSALRGSNDNGSSENASMKELMSHSKSSKGVSYSHLLNPSRAENISEDGEADKSSVYDPDFLDDPGYKTGKHRTVLNLSSFRESIIPFIKPEDLKDELNEQFKQRHPWINPGVTLHRIRKLKRKLLTVTQDASAEIGSLALSYVLLDKMLMKNYITKENLRLYGACCLFLAVKLNDPPDLKKFVECIEEELKVEPKELLHTEFEVFSKLSFSLFVDPKELLTHSIRLHEKLDIILPPSNG